MSADWRAVAKAAGYRVVGSEITVDLWAGRRQTVSVDDRHAPDAIRLSSVILGPNKTSQLAEGTPLEYAWERNRLSDLMGFSVDTKGRLIGESWIPLEGMTVEEFALHLDEVARVCDWHELRLTGVDTY